MRKKTKDIPKRPEIRARMFEEKISITELAAHLGISRETLSCKLEGETDFSITEARRIAEYLHSDVNTLFFANAVAN